MQIYAQICKFMHTAIHMVQVLSVIMANLMQSGLTTQFTGGPLSLSTVVWSQQSGVAQKKIPKSYFVSKSVAKNIKCGKGHSS